jgi:hypothetical protein
MMAKSLMNSGAGDLTASVENDAKLVSCCAGTMQRARQGKLLDRSAACAATGCCRAPLTRRRMSAAMCSCLRGNNASNYRSTTVCG